MLYLARYLNSKLLDKKVTWQWSASPPSSPSRILVDRDWMSAKSLEFATDLL